MTSSVDSNLSVYPPATARLDDLWSYLKQGIDQIMISLSVSKKHYTMLYRTSYNYCTSTKLANRPQGRKQKATQTDLYHRLSDYFAQYLKPIQEKASTLQGLELLEYYNAEWNRYSTASEFLNRLFVYLNRYWVKGERDEGKKHILPVIFLARAQWKECVLSPVNHDLKLTQAILDLIASERQGNPIDIDLVKRVNASFLSLGFEQSDPNKSSLEVYKVHFEGPFLNATQAYYNKRSEEFLAQQTLLKYINQANVWLNEEGDRVAKYLHTSTQKQLIKQCEDTFIRKHVQALQAAFMSLQGDTGDENRERIGSFISRIPEGRKFVESAN